MKKKNFRRKKRGGKKSRVKMFCGFARALFFTYSSRVEKNIHFHDAILFILDDFLFVSLLHP